MTVSLDGSAPTICTWMGVKIDELTRDELLNVVQHLGRALHREREAHKSTLDMWELCRKAGSR